MRIENIRLDKQIQHMKQQADSIMQRAAEQKHVTVSVLRTFAKM
jgi:hypothetical protein